MHLSDKKLDPGKIYVPVNIIDTNISVALNSTSTLYIKNQNITIHKILVRDDKLIEDLEKTLPMLEQINDIVFTIYNCNETSTEIFRKLTYGLTADKVVLVYDKISDLHKYLQHATAFIKVNELILSKEIYIYNQRKFRSLGFGEDKRDELIQDILDICCILIEKEIIRKASISNWGTDPFQVSENIRGISKNDELFLRLGNQGELTGQIEYLYD